MKVLIIGATGVVGTSLYKLCQSNGVETIGTSRSSMSGFRLLDLPRDMGNVYEIAEREGITHCVLCAAYTNVKESANRVQEIFRENVVVPFDIAIICQSLGIHFTYLSSCYANNPITPYCFSKLHSEYWVSSTHASLIVRSTWIFGDEFRVSPKNFIHRSLFAEGNSIVLHEREAEEYSTPTYAGRLAKFILSRMESMDVGLRTFVSDTHMYKDVWLCRCLRAIGSDKRVDIIPSKKPVRPKRVLVNSDELSPFEGHLRDWVNDVNKGSS